MPSDNLSARLCAEDKARIPALLKAVEAGDVEELQAVLARRDTGLVNAIVDEKVCRCALCSVCTVCAR